MKKLQNDFTTPEQSKRLLKLGVPEDSANKVYAISKLDKIYYVDIPEDATYTRYAENMKCILGFNCSPSWSVGRLAEIYNIISMDYVIEELILNWSPIEYSYIEYIIDKLRENIDHGLVDFSKLED